MPSTKDSDPTPILCPVHGAATERRVTVQIPGSDQPGYKLVPCCAEYVIARRLAGVG